MLQFEVATAGDPLLRTRETDGLVQDATLGNHVLIRCLYHATSYLQAERSPSS